MSEEKDTVGRVSRRTFVASGVAAGAAVVWTSPFPFSDSPIGQTAEAQVGPTGTSTPTATATPTGGTGPTATATPTGTTGGTGTTGPGGGSTGSITINAKRLLKERKGNVVVVPVTVVSRAAVKGRVKLDVAIKGKRRSIGSAAYSTPAGGGKAKARIRLNKTGRKLSEDRKRFGVRITATGTGLATKRKAAAIKTLSA